MFSKQDFLDLAAMLNKEQPAPRAMQVDGTPFAVLAEGETLQSAQRVLLNPPRCSGVVVVTAPADFCDALKSLEGLVPIERIYYTATGNVDAILNDDVRAHLDEISAGWRDHRVHYRPEFSEAWKAWSARFPERETKWLSQLDMAEFIEERAGDFVRPDGASMLELAQNFEIVRNGKFASARRLDNGSVQLSVSDEHAPRGIVEIPSDVVLGMRLFEGMGGYQFKAKFRYRIKDDALLLTFRILHRDDLFTTAVNDVLDVMRGALGERLFLRVAQAPDKTTAL